MRPILAEIPQLPAPWFLPLAALSILLGVVFAYRAARLARAVPAGAPLPTEDPVAAATFPLVMGVGLAFAAWIWSRQSIVLHSYGLFLVLGFALAVYLSCLEAKRRGIDPNLIVDLALPLLGFSILACRLLYVILNREQFESLSEVVRVWDGGLSFHGSLVAAPLVVWFYAKRNGLTFGQLGDIIAPSAFLGYAVGRVGCLMNGCCYGDICTLPWAMSFPMEGNRGVMTPLSHPTQLYSTLLGLGLFGLMQWTKNLPSFNRFHGQITIFFFALYAVERGFIEYFRNGATARTVFGTNWLTQAQVASIVALVVLGLLYLVLSRNAERQVARGKPVSAG
jgi:phosphatidylglycerol:prolipoprotein diacylglycerol transferase